MLLGDESKGTTGSPDSSGFSVGARHNPTTMLATIMVMKAGSNVTMINVAEFGSYAAKSANEIAVAIAPRRSGNASDRPTTRTASSATMAPMPARSFSGVVRRRCKTCRR